MLVVSEEDFMCQLNQEGKGGIFSLWRESCRWGGVGSKEDANWEGWW